MAAISSTERGQGTKRKDPEPVVLSSADAASRSVFRRTVTEVIEPPIGELDIELPETSPFFLTQTALNDLARIRYARGATSAEEKLAKQTGFAMRDPHSQEKTHWKVISHILQELIKQKKTDWPSRGLHGEMPVPALPGDRLELKFKQTRPKKHPSRVGVGQSRGARDYQEDRILKDSAVKFGSFEGRICAIFDGHGDDGRAVDHVVDRLGRDFEDILHDAVTRSAEPVLDEIVPDSFCRLAEWLKRSCLDQVRQIGGKRGGTTMTCTLQVGAEMWVANVGDSSAFLVKRRETVSLTEKASLEEGRFRRIHERLGNQLTREAHPRVMGPRSKVGDPVLGVGRANGAHPWMPCTPKITKLVFGPGLDDPLTGKVYCEEDDCLVLATDGVTNNLTKDELGSVVRVARLQKHSMDYVAQETAKLVGSILQSDNGSILIKRLML